MALHLKRKNILFIGAPGSGKGTYSRIISPILMVSLYLEFDCIDTHIWVRRLYEEGNLSENAFWETG